MMFMKKVFYVFAFAFLAMLSFSGCNKGPKIETLSADKGDGAFYGTLSGRVSGLEGVATDFACGIEYSTDVSFIEDNTIRSYVDKKYSEDVFSIIIRDLNPDQTYYYRAFYINQEMVYYGKVKEFCFTWDFSEGQFVDLGLSVNWATCNVGASYPWEYGELYMWGDTVPKKSNNYRFFIDKPNSYDRTIKKYNINKHGYGNPDKKTTLEPEDDVAHVQWGGDWRMPTIKEIKELFNNCDVIYVTINGVYGALLTSNKPGYTDRSIFLPAAGIYEYDNKNVGTSGYYWSSNLDDTDSSWAQYISFSRSASLGTYRRTLGQSVRPVCPK